jgi:hypothetical protein
LSGKRYKSRGFVISFGDIMLPLIGVVAIGLLLLAGRFFFTSDFHPNLAALPVMALPQREKPAQAQERVLASANASAPANASASANAATPTGGVPPGKKLSALPAARPAEAAPPVLAVPDVLAVPYEDKKVSAAPERRTPAPLPKAERGTVFSAGSTGTATRPKPRPVLLPPRPAATAKAAAPKKPAPAFSQGSPNSPKATDSSAWMVQVAAFSSKSAAEDAARQLSKGGRSVNVAS